MYRKKYTNKIYLHIINVIKLKAQHINGCKCKLIYIDLFTKLIIP